MFFIALVLLGAVSYHELPVQLLPNVALPGASIYARYEGLSVSDTVDRLTRPIEGIVAATPRVREINSTTFAGYARIEMLFDFGTDMRFATLNLQDKLTAFRMTLPRRGTYITLRSYGTEQMQSFFMWISVAGREDTDILRQIAEDQLKPQLEAIDGIAEVSLGGHSRDSVDVVFQRDRLAAQGLGLPRVLSRIRSAAGGKMTLGRIRDTHEDFALVLDEVIANEQDLQRLPVDDRGIVRLTDVAAIYRNHRLSEYVSRVNGLNTVGLVLRKDASANPLRLAVKVRAALKEIEASLPPGYKITIVDDTAKTIEEIIAEVRNLAIVGAFLAMVVLMLFVRNLRMAAIVFTAIPISVVTTFNLMYFGGLSLNIITLIGLALGIGMLLDSAIVVLENIFRHFERTRHGLEAAQRGTEEVWRALLATTMTNVVVFAPILFLEGEMSLMFREGALAICFPIVVSLLVALTLVPMATSRILVVRETIPEKLAWWPRLLATLGAWLRRYHPYWPAYLRRPRRIYREAYMMVLRTALRHRVRLLLLMVLVVWLTVYICLPRINRSAMRPDSEGNSFPIYVQVPRGSTRQQLVQALDEVENRLRKIPELEKTRSFGHPAEDATVYVTLVPQKQRKRTLQEVRESVLSVIGEVPGALVSLRPFNMEGTSRSRRSYMSYSEGGLITIYGSHWEEMEWVTVAMARQLELIPGISRVEIHGFEGEPEIHYTLDRNRAALFNLTAADLSSYFETSQRSGQFSQLTLERGDRRIDVLLRMGRIGQSNVIPEQETARPLSEVRSMEILLPSGSRVPLSEVGHFRKTSGVDHLHRDNLQFANRLIYSYERGVNRKLVEDAVETLIQNSRLPAGFKAEIQGESKRIRENERQLLWMLYIIVILIYMVMASVFESLLSPFVIMLSFPLAAVGVLWALVLTGTRFDELAMLGMVILTGIVVNNGIVMMDFISMLRRERGYRRTAAIVAACRARLRPILMTALTTSLGLTPMAFRSNEQINWAGLAVVIISGLCVSTLLTLIVIPAMLMNLEDALDFFKRLGLRLWRWRWVFYFLRPARMRAKRLELAPAGGPLVAAPTFAVAMRRSADAVPAERAEPFDSSPATPETASPPLGVRVRHVRMIYPVRKPRIVLNAIPSRRFKYGARPPEGVEALRNVDLSIEKGMFGLLGPNGAGKTTLLHAMTGLIRPTCGYIEINGYDMARQDREARAQIGYLPQSFGLHGQLTARQYLDYYSLILGIRDRAARERNIAAVLDQVGLAHAADERVSTFSGGMARRLGIARLLLTLPSVIIVDEPTAGLDPIERVKFRVLLSQLAQDRIVILSTHIIDDISSSCRRLAVLNRGRIVFDGTPAGLIARARGRIWEIAGTLDDEPDIARRHSLLHKKAAGPGRVLYRFIADACDLPGALPIEPSLEDAYIFVTRDNGGKVEP